MNSIELNIKCREYNIAYREKFGYIPSPVEYSCNYEEFFEALKKSVETGEEINKYLSYASAHKDGFLD